MKMLTHALSGVQKGLEKGGMPIEIMGLIVGRPSIEKASLRTLIVTDVFPLPVEGK